MNWMDGRKVYEIKRNYARSAMILEWFHHHDASLYSLYGSNGNQILSIRIPDQSWQEREPSFWGDENLSDA